MRNFLIPSLSLILVLQAHSQEKPAGKTDALSKMKVSGYIQAQFQHVDSLGTINDKSGVASVAGGGFPPGVENRFSVRRGRLKVAHEGDLSQYVLQFDVTQKGVGIKDAYVVAKEPWLQAASLKLGVFDRPFGYEISYSSSTRESPERSRLFQTLFPGERELGAQLSLATKRQPYSLLNLKAGIFNGTGPTADENDGNKDFIGRAGFELPFSSFSPLNLTLDGGVSAYIGKVTQSYDSTFSISNRQWTASAANPGSSENRNYFGGDLQLYYTVPVLGGFSLKGEFIAGEQPGTQSSSALYSPKAKAATEITVTATDGADYKIAGPGKPVYLYSRNFMGWYAMAVQDLGSKNQIVVKYDVYDPNTDVDAADFTANLSSGDIRYETLGLGWIYQWDSRLKWVFYYDWVRNEEVTTGVASDKSSLSYTEDLRDNVFTARAQYKF